MTTHRPREAELWRRVMDARLMDVHTALPCEVRSFDATAQTVDVQPLVKNVLKDPDGTELEESYPLIRAVPVIYPRCGTYILAFPLVAGDVVTVVFNEWSVDQVIEKGNETHPVDLQRHAFSGAVAFPGGPFSKDDPVSETVDQLLLGEDGGMLLKIDSSGNAVIASTGASTQPVALADDVLSRLDDLKTTLNNFISNHDAPNSHITTATVGMGGPGVITTVPGTPHGAITEVGSAKVEVEE